MKKKGQAVIAGQSLSDHDIKQKMINKTTIQKKEEIPAKSKKALKFEKIPTDYDPFRNQPDTNEDPTGDILDGIENVKYDHIKELNYRRSVIRPPK